MLPVKTDHYFSSLDDLIYSRRSVRKYKSESPPAEWIKTLVMCAEQAPSPSNRQPVCFVRIASEEKKHFIYEAITSARDHLIDRQQMFGLSKKIKNKINTYFRFSLFMFDAPWLFAVGTEKNDKNDFLNSLVNAGLADKKHSSDTSMDISVGLAMNSFLLKATDLGLGTCVLTAPLVFVPEIEKIIGLSHIKIKCFVTAGFPAENPVPPVKKSFSDVYSEI
ncbi:MAG: nitroreductase family protein [Candidatus Magnetomorum sp.]|nr:nitroreductase family protein [Candidatus Magnetomorum sp.]